MARLAGRIYDAATGETVSARVHVSDSTGAFAHPPDAILKIGPGASFFYSDGSFEVDVTRGWVRVVVERGTEYAPARIDLEAPGQGAVTVDVKLERWSRLGDDGWHPGNTHIHYDEEESNGPTNGCSLDPRVEDLQDDSHQYPQAVGPTTTPRTSTPRAC